MSDENERSVASAGSVVAWAVVDGTKTLVGYHSCSRDKAEAWAREYGFPKVVPLYAYQPPMLTAAERDAIQTAMNAYGSDNANPECAAIEATLWGLLERLK